MYRDGTLIEKNDLAENFAYFFDKKIQDLLLDTNINQGVYNGTQKVQTVESMYVHGPEVCMYTFIQNLLFKSEHCLYPSIGTQMNEK